jgi:hypothetical protein
MPASRHRLDFRLAFTKEEMDRLAEGFVPGDMDDRWFAFYEDGWLYLHRSWTGYCNYQVRFAPHGSLFVVEEAWVNRDPEQYGSTDPESDLRSLRDVLFWVFAVEGQPLDEPGS